MTDEELVELNRKGFIPGPRETEHDFQERVQATQNFFIQPTAEFCAMERVSPTHWNWVDQHLEELFDFQPRSVAAYYSNRQLTPWQGAASWIIDVKPGPLCALQLRCGLKKGSYLGLYSREEILAHEAVHAARCAFEEPLGEEFFAYMTSSRRWRQIFGPIVQKPWEAALFLGACVVGAYWGSVVPSSIVFGVGLLRLIRNRQRMRKASQTLMSVVLDAKKVRAILFRLTDAEMGRLSKGIWVEGDESLRWRVIRLAYL